MSQAPEHISPAGGGKPGKGGWWLLLFAMATHGLVALIDPGLSHRSLAYFLDVLWKLLPVLVVVLFVMWLTLLFTNPRALSRFGGLQGGIKGWAWALGAGILSMGPVYMWYPLLRDLGERGVRTSLIAGFLYARAIKLPWLPVMIHYFGGLYTTTLILCMGAFAVLSGLLVERIVGARLSLQSN